jgi:hypothetical protein
MRIIQISLVLKLVIATNADNSNFFGQNTGSGATNAYGSNSGINAGYNAITLIIQILYYSVVMLQQCSSSSNFIGGSAGQGATEFKFLCNNAGAYATGVAVQILV